jgi:hypothetical protein
MGREDGGFNGAGGTPRMAVMTELSSTGGTGTLMPHLLPGGQLDEWCNAFGDDLVQHASTETLRRTEYRANQPRSFRSK